MKIRCLLLIGLTLSVFLSPISSRHIFASSGAETSAELLKRGYEHFERGEYEKALNEFTRLIELAPNFADAYYYRALVLIELEDFEAAILDLNSAIKYKPKFAEAYVARSLAFINLGEQGEAERDYDRAKEIDPHVGGQGISISNRPALDPSILPAVEEIIEDSLKNLKEGLIVFEPPIRMKLGISNKITAMISADPYNEELFIGRQEKGEVTVEKIRVGKFMKATLFGDNFRIMPISHGEQVVASNEITQWDWLATPLKSGEQMLRLLITVRIKVGEDEENKDFPVFEREIFVDVNPAYTIQNFLSDNSEWVVTVIIIPFLAWILKDCIKVFKRTESSKESSREEGDNH